MLNLEKKRGRAKVKNLLEGRGSFLTFFSIDDVGGAPYIRYWLADSGGSREFYSRFGRAPYPHIWVTGSGRAVAINVDKAFAGVEIG